jgi:hypothetical protein
MHIAFDIRNKFIHFGAKRLDKIEDFIEQGLYLFLLQKGFEDYKISIFLFSTSKRNSTRSRFWFRISWISSFRIEFASPGRPLETGGSFELSLINLANLKSAARLEDYQTKGLRIVTNGTLVRLDADNDQRICDIGESFRIDTVPYMIAKPIHTTQLRAEHISVLLIAAVICLTCFFRVRSEWRTNPHDLSASNEASLRSNHSESFATTNQDAVAKNLSDVEAQKDIPLENWEAEKRKISLGKKNSSISASDPSKDIDPMRCSPIEKRNSKSEKAILRSKNTNKEEWIVCR